MVFWRQHPYVTATAMYVPVWAVLVILKVSNDWSDGALGAASIGLMAIVIGIYEFLISPDRPQRTNRSR
jgi:hypothetical protein